MMLSKSSQKQERIGYDSIYVKFKNEWHDSVVMAEQEFLCGQECSRWWMAWGTKLYIPLSKCFKLYTWYLCISPYYELYGEGTKPNPDPSPLVWRAIHSIQHSHSIHGLKKLLGEWLMGAVTEGQADIPWTHWSLHSQHQGSRMPTQQGYLWTKWNMDPIRHLGLMSNERKYEKQRNSFSDRHRQEANRCTQNRG